MLWDSVYHFFVKHVFGGSVQGVAYQAFLGQQFDDTSGYATTSRVGVFVLHGIDGYGDVTLSLGNYLSLIATIITMVAILLFCVFIIKKIIAIIFRLFTGGSAF